MFGIELVRRFQSRLNLLKQAAKLRQNFGTKLQSRTYANYQRFNNSRQGNLNWSNWYQMLRSRNAAYVGAGVAGFYVYNLHEAPFTHRKRFLWVPYWLERKVGDYSYQQLLSEYQHQILPPNSPVYLQISLIMNKLLAVALEGIDDAKQKENLKSLDWKIHVIQVDSSQPPNAFILPNGKIFIFSSILPICQNSDGLATVLSHELSHQLAHHSSEQISKSPIYLASSAGLYSLTGLSELSLLLTSGLLKLPASREMESEADHIGCELLAKSCFNLKEVPKFWNRMASLEKASSGEEGYGSGLQEFFSTHPATSKRLHDIEGWMPKLEQIKESSACYQYGTFQNATKSFFSL